ncbi:MAG: PD-(D/E)XK nuclease family protein [Richelia sp. RM2_1_2]|nr:PD-(D/E)XK nuclease family protein [Richelia sp. RM2_1_2]
MKNFNHNVAISASRLDTLESCSWLYWCKYHLKLPDSTNAGALKGTCCHNIFEHFLKKKYKKQVVEIIKKRSVTHHKVIQRYISSYIKKYPDYLSEFDIEDINEMLVRGFSSDFFCKGGELQKAEKDFDLEFKNPSFRIKGFIDKCALYRNKGLIGIFDYKSSQKKFSGKKREKNNQALIYEIACEVLFNLKGFIKFIFLRFDDPFQEHKYNEKEIEKFKSYLGEVQKKISNFTREDAISNFAYDQQYPKKDQNGESDFSGPIMCGRAKFPGQLKRDGNPMWYCPFKFPFEYYVLIDSDGKLLKSSFKKEELDKGENLTIKKRKYNGCPRFNQ